MAQEQSEAFMAQKTIKHINNIEFIQSMKISTVLVVYTKPLNDEEKYAFALVRNILKKCNISYKIVHRNKLRNKLLQNNDMVIAVGGDGTFIRASHFIFGKTLVMGVNSNPKYKEGFFMAADKRDFESKIKRIVSGDFKIKKIHRLEAYINNKKVPELALNEFYVASKKQHHTARYFISVRGRRERQKSSGVLISTAAGSHAWIKSAGGKVLPLESDKFEYLVREPYYGRTCEKCSLFNEVLNKNEKVSIAFEVGEGVLIVDSLSKEYKFKAGDKVVVRMSENPLYSVSFA